MNKYKCGHKTKGIIIMDSNPLSISNYLIWVDSVGFEGTKEMCFDCFCKNCETNQLNSHEESE